MKRFQCKKAVVWISAMSAVLFLMAGCGRPFVPSKPFPAPVVGDAIVSMNINADGRFFFVDEKGETVLTKPITFATLVESADLRQDDWMIPLGSFTLYTVKGDGRALLCDKDFKCIERQSGKDEKSAVFSINLTDKVMKQKVAKTLELFFADAEGEVIDKKAFELLPTLLQQKDPAKLKGLVALNNFTVFLIKGSQKLEICANNMCYCCCLHSGGWVSNCDSHGSCQ
jgi:hypothetical protein